MKKYISILIILFISVNTIAQQPDRAPLTREAVLEMSIEDLADLDLEELMAAMDLMGVSSLEELIDLLINRNVYSASGRDESTMVSPLSSSVLTRQEIRDYGATTIEEALRLIPGIIVRQKTNGNFDVHLRGLDNLPTHNMMLYSENTNTLLMIDGRPVFNYAHGAIVWESLPIGFEDIERIEVVRGPASALYGSNAVNGVINILTSKTTSQSPLVSGSVQAGSMNTYTGDLSIRRSFNERLSAAVTTNFQMRDRETDKVNFFDLGEMYLQTGEDEYEPFNGGFLPVNQYQNLRQLYQGHYFNLLTDDIDNLFPDPGLGRENLGVNAYINYDISTNSSIDLSGGYQNSYVNSSPVGDLPRALAGRKSSTGYFNLIANLGDLRVQSNYMGGVQDFSTGETGFKIDMGQFNANAEYDFHINSFNIRPGVSYQNLYYDDTPYLETGEDGYLNAKRELNTLGLSLRLDYMLFNRIRLISALRTEKYNNPDKWYTSWQFAGTLPINENQTVRAVYSRANRSSFIVNAHSNYTWDRTGRTPPNFVHFNGNPEADLLTTDMVEFGYRVRPNNRILLDLELFASKTQNFGALMTDYSGIFNVMELVTGQTQTPETHVYITYNNMDLEATQIGASFNLDYIISEKIITRFHGTIQHTKLDNYSNINRNQITQRQLLTAGENLTNLIGGIMAGQIQPTAENLQPVTSDWQPTEFEDGVKHKNTPSFWGMAGIIYRPTDKLTIASDTYFYSSQTYQTINGDVNIDSKIILNSKISYKATDNLSIFINARNLINNDSPEFGYMDNIGALYLGGIQFIF
ncbi:TonB-dependent receptor plug domain-containing protein [Natronoflexus pectinivorans]|uniref:Iron complex outermembrane receptor protein n=1 Tax=Natronoflexus pectinivorans TaxID=682526 RepID=A0A4R2GLL8_9BACT|nr:TonB-dependent receptor plug domain-containing protein [Natronoflexus pectinivorans]TCO09833.1 iron complex outermembrane receptor protein [Natronoflexus pectinivorans]